MGTPILAQYTIRSKQDYIFRTNRIVEIMGASANISNAWNVLFDAAKEALEVGTDAGKKVLRVSDQEYNQEDFHLSDILEAFSNGSLCMAELFCGGGNETVLLDSIDTFKKINQVFSYKIMTDYPGMIPMSEYCEVSGDYKKDYAALMAKSERFKNTMIPGRNEFILPFSMMDRDTFQPITGKIKIENKEMNVTSEGLSKRKTGLRIRSNDESVKLLDRMVTKKGEEGLLAVVHADGNNMGSKIMDMLGDHTDYDFCIKKMREFTKETHKVFVENGKKALYECRDRLKSKYGNKYKNTAFAFREVIADGDDMTFICNARFVMEYVNAYLKAVETYPSEWRYSSCAGICIFHSHYPFARAYSLAEQCCDDTAKKMVHKTDENGKQLIIEEGWVDFHYVHSGISGDLSHIRHVQGTGGLMARPWRCCGEGEHMSDYANLEKLLDILREHNVARSNIKGIASAIEDSIEDGHQELVRVYGHTAHLEEALSSLYKDQNLLLKAIYDLAEMYDLWFKEV